MNKLFTVLIGLGNPLWRALGADPHAIRLIVAAKLKMDDRSGVVMGRRQQKQKGMEWFVYLMLLVFGAMMVYLPAKMADTATAVGLVYSVMMVYIGMLLITEMSENMFDQRDLYVLLSRPINDLTLSLARILHITAFSAKFALLLATPVAIYLAIFRGIIPFFAFTILGVMAVVLTMTGTLVSYLLLLRRVPKERLKKILGYFQMVITFVFFFAYQIPNLFGDQMGVIDDVKLVDQTAGFTFPGLWLGGLYKLLSGGGAGAMALGQAALGLAAVVGGSWFYVRQSRGYVSNMLALRDSGSAPPETKSLANENTNLRDRLANWLTAPNLGRVSFRFHWNMMSRDMGFKQRTYPAMVYLPVLIIIMALRDAWAEGDFSLGIGTVFLVLYFVAWITIIPLGQTKISEDYRASWIFQATGNDRPGQLRYGQLMAVLSMFYLPTALIVYPVILLIWGPHLWLDVLYAAGNVLLVTMLYHAVDRDPPFGRSKEDAKFANFGPMILVSITASALGGVHYYLSDTWWLIAAGTLVTWGIVLAWGWSAMRGGGVRPTKAASASG